MAARPISIGHDRRPIALHAPSSSVPEIVPFKVRIFLVYHMIEDLFQGENIVLLQLDFPSRTTRDYEGPMVSPMIQAAIDKAMKDEEHIELDVKQIEEFDFLIN